MNLLTRAHAGGILIGMPPPHEYSRMTDEELARRGDDARAFTELHGRLNARLSGYLFSLIRDSHLADDLAHDTWLKAMPTIQCGAFKGNFTAWLFRIAQNTARDWLNRKKSVLLSNEQATAFPDRVHEDDSLLEHVGRLKQCLEKLKPPLGEIIRSICEGAKPSAIAAKLQLTPERVHKLKFNAMRDLRICMGVETA